MTDPTNLAEQLTELLTTIGELPAARKVEVVKAVASNPASQALGFSFADPEVVTAGGRVGAYTLVQQIGSGAFGQVYLALRNKLIVALKILPKCAEMSKEDRKRFEAEINMLSAAQHQNVVELKDFRIDASDNCFIATKYVHGPDLDQFARKAAFPRVLRAFRDVCIALSHLDSKGIVHGDLKPANVKVHSATGKAVIIDFGLARWRDDVFVNEDRLGFAGTPAYMSPEQASGQVITPSSDIYSIGVILFEIVTGRLPYELPRVRDHVVIKNAIINSVVPPLKSTPSDPDGVLNEIVARATMKDPEDRLSINELMERLTALIRLEEPVRVERASRNTATSSFCGARTGGELSKLLSEGLCDSGISRLRWLAENLVAESMGFITRKGALGTALALLDCVGQTERWFVGLHNEVVRAIRGLNKRPDIGSEDLTPVTMNDGTVFWAMSRQIRNEDLISWEDVVSPFWSSSGPSVLSFGEANAVAHWRRAALPTASQLQAIRETRAKIEFGLDYDWCKLDCERIGDPEMATAASHDSTVRHDAHFSAPDIGTRCVINFPFAGPDWMGELVANLRCYYPMRVDGREQATNGYWGQMNQIQHDDSDTMSRIVFNGDSSCIIVPHNQDLDFGVSDFSILLWVRFESVEEEQVLVEKYVETGRWINTPGKEPQKGWTLTKLKNRVIRFAGPITGQQLCLGDWTVPVEVATWNHVAISRSKEGAVLWWNGDRLTPTCQEWPQIARPDYETHNVDSPASLKIGKRGTPDDTPGSVDTRGFFLNGRIAHLMLFGAGVTSREVRYLMDQTREQD